MLAYPPIAIDGRWNRVGASLLIFASVLITVGGLGAQAAITPLDRPIDIVTLTGADLPVFLNSSVDRIHVYRWTATGFQAVPFQIDEVDSEVDLMRDVPACLNTNCSVPNFDLPVSLCEENYSFNFATGTSPGHSDEGGSGVFDLNDELVFRAEDSSVHCAPSDEWLPSDAGDPPVGAVRYDIVIVISHGHGPGQAG